jgi:Ca-activated chloride channel homolog
VDDKATVRLRTFLPPLIVLAAALGAALLTRAQSRGPGAQPPTFGAEIEVVNLNVSITNVTGQFVTDLKERDIAVFEDGVRQKLTIFSHEDLPISLVLLIDGSASMQSKLTDARAAAVQFLHTLRARDSAQVVQFSDRITVLQDFTSDQKALEDAVARTDAAGPTAIRNALYVSLKELAKEKKRGGETRRRAIVVLSDGEDTASLVSDEQVLDLTRKTEIGIYPIMLRGHTRERNRPGFSEASYLLNTLAQDSGGRAFQPNSISELDAIYGRIAEELRSLYSIGYVSSNPRRDGKWRRIVVHVPEHDDYTIRHKIGYYATTP